MCQVGTTAGGSMSALYGFNAGAHLFFFQIVFGSVMFFQYQFITSCVVSLFSKDY
jgi:hypothetical protein